MPMGWIRRAARLVAAVLLVWLGLAGAVGAAPALPRVSAAHAPRRAGGAQAHPDLRDAGGPGADVRLAVGAGGGGLPHRHHPRTRPAAAPASARRARLPGGRLAGR